MFMGILAVLTASWYGPLLGATLAGVRLPDLNWVRWAVLGWCVVGVVPLGLLIPMIRDALTFSSLSQLTLSEWPAVLGGEVEMSFQRAIGERRTVASVDARLCCEEIHEYSDETFEHTIAEHVIPVTDFIKDGKLVHARWRMKMPSDWLLPGLRHDKRIAWVVYITIRLVKGSEGRSSFRLSGAAPPKRRKIRSAAWRTLTPK